jgi:hypothetical protein
LAPLHRNAPVGTRAVPIRFQEVSRVKRPGKRASDADKKRYKEAVKRKHLSRSFVEMGEQLRQELDLAGGRQKILVFTGDGSFCNRTCFGQIPERSSLLVRARMDAKLCFRATAGSRRFYDPGKFTPGQVRQWTSTKLYYRDPAYLHTSDLANSVKPLLQIYSDRWQREVNHREEKDTLGPDKRNYGTLSRRPSNPSWRWRHTALSCWPPYEPLAQSVETLMRNFQSGVATLDDLLAST